MKRIHRGGISFEDDVECQAGLSRNFGGECYAVPGSDGYDANVDINSLKCMGNCIECAVSTTDHDIRNAHVPDIKFEIMIIAIFSGWQDFKSYPHLPGLTGDQILYFFFFFGSGNRV